MKKELLGSVFTVVLIPLAFAATTKYAIDPVHGSIGFSVQYWGINEIQGLFQ